MRLAYAHDAVVVMDPDADPRALGAAVTVELCGSWQHEPPCPLAPHHTGVSRIGDEVHLRILFAAEEADVPTVRRRIDTALRGGSLRGPDGTLTRWRWRSSRPAEVAPAEREHAERLARG